MRSLVWVFMLACGGHAHAVEVAMPLPAAPPPAPPPVEVRDEKGHTASEWVELGDDAFVHTKLVDAARFYEQAIAAGRTDVTAYAYYKLAFVRWNQNDGRAALDAFVQAIRSNNDQIAARARKDIIPVYAQNARVDAAYAFFRVLTPDPLSMLAHLEREYAGVGKCDAARDIAAQITSHGGQVTPSACP